MARRGDICQPFNASMFRLYLRKKYKNHQSFAKRIGVSRQAVDAWVNGKSKPTWKHLIMMGDIFNISPRMLILSNKRFILDRWEDHLMDYLMAPPELKHQTKTEVKIGDGEGGSETRSEMKTERELKLSEKGAIELTEKLGIFEDNFGDNEEDDDDDEFDEFIP